MDDCVDFDMISVDSDNVVNLIDFAVDYDVVVVDILIWVLITMLLILMLLLMLIMQLPFIRTLRNFTLQLQW